jgi:predicted transcriptional regulator of viral defense system
MESLEQKILAVMRSKGRGSICSAADFLQLGSREAVDQALSRLVRKGVFHRISRGLYLFPVENSVAGILSPDPVKIAQTEARKTGARLLIGEAYAAYTLGLTQQIPATITFLTDGKAGKITVGALTVVLKRTSAKKMAVSGRVSGQVIQALRFLGKEAVNDPNFPSLLSDKLTTVQKKELAHDIRFAPVWMQKVLRQIVMEPKRE